MLGFELGSVDCKTLKVSSTPDCVKGACVVHGPDYAKGVFCGKSKDPGSSLDSTTEWGTAVGWMVAPKNVCPCFNLHNLWILPYMVEDCILPYMAKDVTGDFEGRSLSWFIQMGPMCLHKCLCNKEMKGDNTAGRGGHRGGGNVKTEQRDAATTQGVSPVSSHLPREHSPAITVILDFWPKSVRE